MSEQTKNSNWGSNISKISLLLLTFLLLGTVIYLIRNVLHAILLGIFFAIILYPLNKKLRHCIRRVCLHLQQKRKKISVLTLSCVRKIDNYTSWISSLLLVLIVFCIIAFPLSLFLLSMAKQGASTLPSAEKWVKEELKQKIDEYYDKHKDNIYFKKITPVLQEIDKLPILKANSVADGNDQSRTVQEKEYQQNKSGLPSDITTKIINTLRLVLQNMGSFTLKILSQTGILAFNFFIMLFVMFHIFQDGSTIWHYIKRISPLDEDAQKKVAIRTKEVSRAIFFSIFGTACIQAIFAMIFFKIVGIPALFWGFILGLCSIIPIVGTGLIWVPATIYLYLTGHPYQAVFIFLSCGCFTSNLDSILRPLLIKKGGKTGMSYLVLFFSVLGGLQTFGLVGVIYGPIITGICSICLLMFSTQFKNSRINNA